MSHSNQEIRRLPRIIKLTVLFLQAWNLLKQLLDVLLDLIGDLLVLPHVVCLLELTSEQQGHSFGFVFLFFWNVHFFLKKLISCPIEGYLTILWLISCSLAIFQHLELLKQLSHAFTGHATSAIFFTHEAVSQLMVNHLLFSIFLGHGRSVFLIFIAEQTAQLWQLLLHPDIVGHLVLKQIVQLTLILNPAESLLLYLVDLVEP